MIRQRFHVDQRAARQVAVRCSLHKARNGAANIAFAASAGLIAGCLLSPLLWTSPAAASSLTNREDAAVTIKITEGVKRIEHTLQTNQRLDGICLDGCIVDILGREDSSYTLEGNEDVSLEDGLMYYDGTQDTVPAGQEPAK